MNERGEFYDEDGNGQPFEVAAEPFNHKVYHYKCLQPSGNLDGNAMRVYLVCGYCPVGWAWLSQFHTTGSNCGMKWQGYTPRFEVWPGNNSAGAGVIEEQYKAKGKGAGRHKHVMSKYYEILSQAPPKKPEEGSQVPVPTTWEDAFKSEHPLL